MLAGKGLIAGNQWHRHANKGQGLGKWNQTPSCTILIQGHFQRSLCLGDRAWEPGSAGCPTACARLIQLKGQVFSKQRWKHEFYLGRFLFQIEKLHKERTNTHFHERREEESIPLCHPPHTTNYPNLSHRTGCSPGRQGVLTQQTSVTSVPGSHTPRHSSMVVFLHMCMYICSQ